MRLVHICRRFVLSITIAGAGMLSWAGEPIQQRHILYLSAEGVDHPYFSAAYLAFKSELDQLFPQQTAVYVENLDLAKFTGQPYRAALQQWLRDKYANVRIDAVVTAGTPALRFAAESRLWPDVPTYFSNTNAILVAAMQLPPNFAGQTFAVDFGDTVALVRKLLPGTRRIVLIGNAPANDVYRPQFDKELADHAKDYAVEDLRGRPLDEVLAAVAQLKEDTVIFRIGFNRPASSQLHDSFTITRLVAEAASRPVFVDYTVHIGLGALGGAAVDPEPQGRNAARKVAELLNGAAPASLGITRLQFPPTFDWRQMQRWGIPEASLPAGSNVRFYSPGPWERYRWQILLTAAVIAALASLVVALLVERRRRAVAVAESRDRLAELAHLNRNATAMVYSGAIAHELNQPLAAILANAQAARMMLAMQPPALGEIGEILNDIERDDQRASDLIRGMRGMLKKGEVRHEVLDIGGVVAQAVQFLRSEAAVRKTEVRMQLPATSAYVLGDRIQLQQVLINLLINSMDAMADQPPASRSIDVAVTANDADAVRITVTDAGSGFTCDMEHVFTSFTTTKAHGTGMGLAITAALVREHGGSIAAANLEGRGAQVMVTLPQAPLTA
ncbi:sensor histidine kinase [Noviherbaspirillum sp. ST9]|uniref:sensor histidine kinase n=1 Tax=Noviherbaspirillum sp. ST9 TaxID=3401606 RepID=UPI003B5886A2